MTKAMKQERTALNGDEAVAYAAKQSDVDVVAAYPITPQTIIVEKFSEYVANGEVQTEFVCTESEHSALAACLAASATGARTFTASASAGLALMHEMLFVTSGCRAPVVMAIANRALSAPLNIHGDQSDSMAERDSGWVQIYVENAQEAYDSIIQAFRIAEDISVSLPVIVGLDGFTLSHTLENVTVLSDDDVMKFVGTRQLPNVLTHEGKIAPFKLDPENPMTMGPIALTNYYFEFKRQQEEAEAWKYGGRGDLTFNLDTQKLGLWPGGHFTVEVEGNFTDSVNGLTGALNPANTNQLFPMPTGDNLNVPNVSFMQILSPYAAVMLGKLALLTPTSGDMNEFAHGKGDTQFMNGAFNINPVGLLIAPYSTLGAGLIILPTKDPHEAIIGFSVFQSNGKASTSGFEDLHSNQLTFMGEARVRTNFFGLTGHQLIGGGYSNKKFTSLDQSLRFFIETRTIEEKKGAWMVCYNFDQYLYETEKGSGQGIGIFGRFGASDGNPNPMHYFYSIGIGGKGIIPGRPLDRFGLGYYYMDVRNPKFTGPLATRELLRDEYGFEAFYNIAITPWLQLTPDIQVVRPAQKEFLDTSGIIPARNYVGTATVFGLRLQMVF